MGNPHQLENNMSQLQFAVDNRLFRIEFQHHRYGEMLTTVNKRGDRIPHWFSIPIANPLNRAPMSAMTVCRIKDIHQPLPIVAPNGKSYTDFEIVSAGYGFASAKDRMNYEEGRKVSFKRALQHLFPAPTPDAPGRYASPEKVREMRRKRNLMWQQFWNQRNKPKQFTDTLLSTLAIAAAKKQAAMQPDTYRTPSSERIFSGTSGGKPEPIPGIDTAL